MSDVAIAHLAGPDLTVDGRRLRQRCAWCGAVLLDYDLERVAVQVEPGEEPGRPATWPPGSWVQVRGGSGVTAYVALDWDEDRYPDGACMAIPDEATA